MEGTLFCADVCVGISVPTTSSSSRLNVAEEIKFSCVRFISLSASLSNQSVIEKLFDARFKNCFSRTFLPSSTPSWKGIINPKLQLLSGHVGKEPGNLSRFGFVGGRGVSMMPKIYSMVNHPPCRIVWGR